jgi:cAMP-dependent protein kinase regulator
MARLKSAVSNNFLFTHLDEEQFSQVLLALVEKPLPNKDMRVITQGDVGDYFYVVEKGDFDIYVNQVGRMMPGPDGLGKKVNSIGPGGSFGELALMYNAPRAATVVSTTAQNILWALDRVTFRRILMENTFKRRRMYEAFLEEVPLLSPLVSSERSKIADSLDTDTYEPGATIIKEGDPGDRFYFIEQGVAEVHKSSAPGGSVRTLNKGDYFGELALLNDAPRAASIIAQTKVKVAYLGKDGFQRLLGPVADIMRRNDPRLGESVDPLSGAPGASGLDGSADRIQEAAGRGRPVEV